MYHEMKIAGLTRQLPLCPLNEDLYIAGFIMFGDVELTEACAKMLLEKAPKDFDVIVTAESKGIPLAYEMSRLSGKKYMVLRKEAKLYMRDVVKTSVDSITTAHVQTLCLSGEDADYMRGKKVLIADDVISTGGSLSSIEKLVNKVDAEIVAKVTVLAEGDAAKRDDIIFLEELPLFNSNGEPLK